VKTKSQSSSTVVGAFCWAKARWRHAAGYSAIDNASITAFTIHEVTTDGDGAGAPSQVSLRGEALTLIFISIGDLRWTSFHLQYFPYHIHSSTNQTTHSRWAILRPPLASWSTTRRTGPSSRRKRYISCHCNSNLAVLTRNSSS
jgi:hypothetical protein